MRRPLVMLVYDTLHVVGRADLASLVVVTLDTKTVYDVSVLDFDTTAISVA